MALNAYLIANIGPKTGDVHSTIRGRGFMGELIIMLNLEATCRNLPPSSDTVAVQLVWYSVKYGE